MYPSMNSIVAMVILNHPTLPEELPLRKKLEDQDVISFIKHEQVISFEMDSVTINCGLIEAPMPRSALEGPLVTSRFWRGDSNKIEEHKSHLVVAASGSFEKKKLALYLSRAIAGIIQTVDAIAVYWGAGGVITQTEIFVDFMKETSMNLLPLYLWVDFRCLKEEDGSLSLFTTGMTPFGLMEFEALKLEMDEEDLVDLIHNFAHYILERGPILNDGETIGMSELQKFSVTHTQGSFHKDQTVYNIQMAKIQ